MTTPAQPPLRGDALWRAQKQEIAARNEAAYKRGRAVRAEREAARSARMREADDLLNRIVRRPAAH